MPQGRGAPGERRGGAVGNAVSDYGQLLRGYGMAALRREPHRSVMPAVQAAGEPPKRPGGMVIVSRQGRSQVTWSSGVPSLLPPNSEILKSVRQATSAGA